MQTINRVESLAYQQQELNMDYEKLWERARAEAQDEGRQIWWISIRGVFF